MLVWFCFLKYRIYRQYYSLTCFSTRLHVSFLTESQNNHFSPFQWKFPYMLNRVQWTRRFYVRLLGAQSKQYFLAVYSEVLAKSGHQTQYCERGCTDPVQSVRLLTRIFFRASELTWVRPSWFPYVSESVLIFTTSLALLVSTFINQ